MCSPPCVLTLLFVVQCCQTTFCCVADYCVAGECRAEEDLGTHEALRRALQKLTNPPLFCTSLPHNSLQHSKVLFERLIAQQANRDWHKSSVFIMTSAPVAKVAFLHDLCSSLLAMLCYHWLHSSQTRQFISLPEMAPTLSILCNLKELDKHVQVILLGQLDIQDALQMHP